MGPNVILLMLIITISSNIVLTQNKIDVNVVLNGELYKKRIINTKSDLISELDSIILEQKQNYKSIEKTPEFWNVYYKNKLINDINDSTLNNLHNNDFLYLYYNQKGLNELYVNIDVINKIMLLVKKFSSKSNDSSDGSNTIDKNEIVKIVESIVTSDYFKAIIQALLFNSKGFDWNLVTMLLTNSSFSSSLKSIISLVSASIKDNIKDSSVPIKDDKKYKTAIKPDNKKKSFTLPNVEMFKLLNKKFNNSNTKKVNKRINKRRGSKKYFEQKKKELKSIPRLPNGNDLTNPFDPNNPDELSGIQDNSRLLTPLNKQ